MSKLTPPQPRSVPPRAAGVIETLEPRQLLSWSPYAKVLGMDQAEANFPNITGAGEAVAVIDSGVNYHDSALGGGIGPGFKVEAGYDFLNKDGDPFPDTYAHGTGTAGLIAANQFSAGGYTHRGVAPGVKIIALRQGDASQTNQALQWVLDNRVKYNIVAVNILDYAGSSPRHAYKANLAKLDALGVFVAHPAGNGGASKPVSKGLIPDDFAIGAADLHGGISTFSQRGSNLDLLAPAQDVPILYYDIATRKPFTTISWGTSWASPVTVATAALIKQVDPRFTPSQIMKIMQDSGANVYDSVTKITYKRLNVNAAIGLAYQRRGGQTPQPPSSSGPTPVGKQSPFKGTPFRITPAASGTTVIQAEDFDKGGEGVSYHDSEAANRGRDNYRAGYGVDIGAASGGGRAVNYAYAGEWIEYTVYVPKSGTYTLGARVANSAKGGRFHIDVDGKNRTGTLGVTKSKRGRTWFTPGKSGIALSAGNHVLRLRFDKASGNGQVGNFDSLQVTRKRNKVTRATVEGTAAVAPTFATAPLRIGHHDDVDDAPASVWS
jgi:hypothetical protein